MYVCVIRTETHKDVYVRVCVDALVSAFDII